MSRSPVPQPMRAAKHGQESRSADPDVGPIWEKLKVLSLVFSSLAVPIVLAVLGNTWSSAQKQDEIGVRYVELAASILRSSPTPETRSMRLWAISVIDHYSQVPLPPSAKQELEFQRLQEQMQVQYRQMEEYMRQRMQGEEAQRRAQVPERPSSGVR